MIEARNDEILTDEEDVSDVDDTGALPSHLEQLESEGQPMLRRSEWERKLPGKLLNFFTDYRATSVGLGCTQVLQRNPEAERS